jgi:lysine 2,3-aminomutase
MRNSLRTPADYRKAFQLSAEELGAWAGAESAEPLFQVRTTPYYASLARADDHADPLRLIQVPRVQEVLAAPHQSMLDPLGERRNNPAPRVIHRYPDRCLLLVTDTCSVYCRYCTRKHFTGQDQSLPPQDEYQQSLEYIRRTKSLREVILSGGDPLTLGNGPLERILEDLSTIEHIEILRIGTRMPVVCPMRIDLETARLIARFNPVYIMVHFNHPRELTDLAAEALTHLADAGLPIFNQMVLLNGVNNHPALVQSLSRRLLALRVKPYYMFQCDPSHGTDHLRTSIDDSLEIQRELWGRLSGLAMPNLSVDIPDGGGKAALVPNFETSHNGEVREYQGWDGVRAPYISPPASAIRRPRVEDAYLEEWARLRPLPVEHTSLQIF